MLDVMLDIETLGTTPGSVILSIGAVEFDATGLGRSMYVVISQGSCRTYKLAEDAETVSWWASQTDSARRVLDESRRHDAASLPVALGMLAGFVAGAERLWSKGVLFDFGLLEAAYRACSVRIPWDYRQPRCFRTWLKSVPAAKEPQVQRDDGSEHNALGDAMHQARVAVALLHRTTRTKRWTRGQSL